MKELATWAAILALTAWSASAGSLDRSGQPVDILFEPGGETGSYLELSYATTTADVSGTGVGRDFDAPLAFFGINPGSGYSGVGNDLWQTGAGLKYRLTPGLSAALIYDQPFGSGLDYNGASDSTELGGTRALARTNALTALMRYEFDRHWSAHAGLRYQTAEGRIGLSGLAYGLTPDQIATVRLLAGPDVVIPSVNGYDVKLERDPAWGWVVGGAFSLPEIALRVALTYSSAITHRMKTTEDGLGAFGLPDGLVSRTRVKTPQSVNLDFQTGIAPDTLLFGSIRWVEWSKFRIDPKHFFALTGAALVDLANTTTYQLGIARQINDQWAGSVSVSYEPRTSKVNSPLAPTNGHWGLTIGVSRDFGKVRVSGGANYTWLGDADPTTGPPYVRRARFTDNSALSFGLRVGYEF